MQDRVSLGFGQLYASVGDHIGHFYESGEEEQEVLVSFLKTGLEGRDKCVCLVGAGRRRETLLDRLRAAGIDVEAAIASDQLFVDEGSSDPEVHRQVLRESLATIT